VLSTKVHPDIVRASETAEACKNCLFYAANL